MNMTIKEKLQLVQRLTRKSQEKLAVELGVSFATLNSWINGRSLPRKGAASRIDEFYLRTTGQNVIPVNVLDAKKAVIMQKCSERKDVLGLLFSRKDLYDAFALALTYNTNRMEGSSLSEPETAAIMFENAALPDKNIIEQMEVKNHQAALGHLFRHVEGKLPLDEAFVLKMHGMLLNGIREDAGRYRNHGVRIVGSQVATANYLKVPVLMKELFHDVLRANAKRKDVIAQAANIHSRFERIHPFSDGNGRVGRLLLDAMLLRANLPPAIIRQENRRFYILYLSKSQLHDDFSLLEDFFCDAVLDAFAILEDEKESS